mmetsp:Transcript_33034/g.98317  ORF Transcript_33034/g.98317 Transcript_33034/m.98317 type:complete len:244 (+) Transcript_33034:281-1012(+)
MRRCRRSSSWPAAATAEGCLSLVMQWSLSTQCGRAETTWGSCGSAALKSVPGTCWMHRGSRSMLRVWCGVPARAHVGCCCAPTRTRGSCTRAKTQTICQRVWDRGCCSRPSGPAVRQSLRRSVSTAARRSEREGPGASCRSSSSCAAGECSSACCRSGVRTCISYLDDLVLRRLLPDALMPHKLFGSDRVSWVNWINRRGHAGRPLGATGRHGATGASPWHRDLREASAASYCRVCSTWMASG